MKEEERAPDPADEVPILDRPDASGFTGKWWPLAALAIISLLLVRACIDAAPPAAEPPATGVPSPLQGDKPG
jgi:hypothetical protein